MIEKMSTLDPPREKKIQIIMFSPCENCKVPRRLITCPHCQKQICSDCKTLCFGCGELIFYCCLNCGCDQIS